MFFAILTKVSCINTIPDSKNEVPHPDIFLLQIVQLYLLSVSAQLRSQSIPLNLQFLFIKALVLQLSQSFFNFLNLLVLTHNLFNFLLQVLGEESLLWLGRDLLLLKLFLSLFLVNFLTFWCGLFSWTIWVNFRGLTIPTDGDRSFILRDNGGSRFMFVSTALVLGELDLQAELLVRLRLLEGVCLVVVCFHFSLFEFSCFLSLWARHLYLFLEVEWVVGAIIIICLYWNLLERRRVAGLKVLERIKGVWGMGSQVRSGRLFERIPICEGLVFIEVKFEVWFEAEVFLQLVRVVLGEIQYRIFLWIVHAQFYLILWFNIN